MSDIFISYAKKDKSRVEPLGKALEEQGWSIWWDRTIPAGKTWDEVIEEELNAAKCVIVVWSENSKSSRWVRAEAEEGLKRNNLVPVSIEDVVIPLLFRPIQSARLINWQEDSTHPQFEKLVSDLSAILGPSPLKSKDAEQKRLEEEQSRKQQEERQRREEQQQRKEAKHKADEERKLKKAEAERKAEIDRKRKEAEEKRKTAAEKEALDQPEVEPSIKSSRFESILFPIFLGAFWGLILIVAASLIVGDFRAFLYNALFSVFLWAAIGAICGYDTRAIKLLVAGFFAGAIIWKFFDYKLDAPILNFARAVVVGGAIGALIGSIAGRIFSKYKKAN